MLLFQGFKLVYSFSDIYIATLILMHSEGLDCCGKLSSFAESLDCSTNLDRIEQRH